MGFFDTLSRLLDAGNGRAGNLTDLLKQMKQKDGTELRIAPGCVPQAMAKGRLLPLTEFTLTADEARELCYTLFTDAQRAEFDNNSKIEFGFGMKGIGPIHAKIVSVQGKISGTFTVPGQR